uniref:RNA-directed DNA polymerase n=1 Tax=Parastrongyloides trichosuri TaxID=131310 RepID=A0A0N4ZZQ6_PARTI
MDTWKSATFDSLKGDDIADHLMKLEFLFDYEEVETVKKKIAITAMTCDRYVQEFIRDMNSEDKTDWSTFRDCLKKKYGSHMSQSLAREELKNFRINERQFKDDAEKFYKIYKIAYPSRNDDDMIEKVQELLARNDRVWDHMQRNMSSYVDYMNMVVSVDAFFKSEHRRTVLVGDKRSTKIIPQIRDDVPTCLFCNRKGHTEVECRKKARACYSCGSLDHSIRDCPTTKEEQSAKKEVRRVAQRNSTGGVLIKVKVIFQDQEVAHLGYLDSGSDITLISHDLAFKLNTLLQPATVQVYAGNNEPMYITHECNFTIKNGSRMITVRAGVLQTNKILQMNSAHILLGNDILRALGDHSINYDEMTVTLAGICYDAVPISNDIAPDIHVKADRCLRIKSESVDDPLAVEAWLDSYNTIFALDSSDLGTLPYTVKTLDFIADKPLPKICRYSNPKHIQDCINIEVDSMINSGVLEKCFTPRFISNLVVSTRKKDNKKRICADLRSLNSCIQRIPTYLPSPDTIISELCKAEWFFQVDLASGYYQITLAPDIREFFAIFTSQGIYNYTRLPFGFINSTVYFQYGMLAALDPITVKYADDKSCGFIVYVDDLIGYADSPEKLHCIATDILNAFETVGARLRREKCQFFARSVNFLSYTITHKTVTPQPSAITNIIHFKIPETISQVRRWLGMVGYYAKHIPQLQQTLSPITALLKKHASFNFSSDCLNAFHQVNNILNNDPVLLIADPAKEYYLEVDSSRDAMGAVLSQYDEVHQLRPCAYYSKRFPPRSRPISVSMLELNGIILALRHFRHTINQVTILTDHKPLLGLLKHGKSPELFRYLAFIESAGIDIKYQAGSKMLGSDALSRQHLRRITKISKEEQLDNTLSIVEESGTLSKLHVFLCHLGQVKAASLLKQFTNIPNVEKKYKEICETCETCQKVNRHLSRYSNIKIAETYPLQSVSVDLKGPMKPSKEGYRYIFGCVDTHSRFVWLKPLYSTSMNESLEAIKEFIYLYGKPSIIRADNAQTFSGHKQLSELGIKLKSGIPYHSQSQTRVERMFGTLSNILTKLEAEKDYDNGLDWSDHLTKIAYVLNNSAKIEGQEPARKFLCLPVNAEDMAKVEIIDRVEKEKNND